MDPDLPLLTFVMAFNSHICPRQAQFSQEVISLAQLTVKIFSNSFFHEQHGIAEYYPEIMISKSLLAKLPKARCTLLMAD